MAEFSDKSTLSKFDIIKFAKNILSEVEEIRSFDNLTDEETADNFKVPNESRVNAFFRLIGLPMFISLENKNKSNSGKSATGLSYLSPGFSTNIDRLDLSSNYIIKNSNAVEGKNISQLLVDRESTLQAIENSIGSDDMNRKMALSLVFPAPLTTNIPDEENKVEGQIGSGSNKREAYKKLFPLITMYQEILPRRNEIAVPFTLREEKKIDNTTELQCPFIETVVRMRLINAENAGSISDKDRESEQLLSLAGRLPDEDFIEITQKINISKAENILDTFILNKLFVSIEQLANKWVAIKKKQHLVAIQNVFDISVKTTSSKRNPLGKRVDVSSNLNSRKDSASGLTWLRKKEAEEEAFLSLLLSDGILNSSGYDSSSSSSQVSNTFSGALINEFTDLLNNNLTQIKKEIRREEALLKKQIQAVEQLRLEIDMMTGEFSGLSVPDVVAVIIGLFLIPKKQLVELLDENIIEKMKKDPVLGTAITQLGATPSAANAYDAILRLETAVSSVFSVLQSQIKAIEDKEKRSTKKGPRKIRKQQKTETSLSNRTAQSQSE